MTSPTRTARALQAFADLPSLVGLLPLAGLLLVWQILPTSGSPYFPPPSEWWSGLAQLAKTGRLLPAFVATTQTIVVALAFAVIGGVAIGTAVGMSRALSRALGPLLEFCRAMPPPAIVPLAILFLGYDERMKLSIVAASAVWPILLNASTAVRHLHPLLSDVASSFRLTALQRARLIVIPAIVPAILIGIRVALPLTIVLTLLVEILTSIDGIGALMIAAQRNFQSGQVYGLLVVVGLFGFVLNNAFALLQAVVMRRWPPQARH